MEKRHGENGSNKHGLLQTLGKSDQ